MEMAHGARTAQREASHPNYLAWTKSGLVAGVIAGLTFAAFEMLAALIISGNFFAPLRMIAATVLGPQALTTDVSLGLAAFTGVLVHMIYSIISGAVFALVIAAVRTFHSTKSAVIFTASVLGLVMWLVNFYIIAPAFGWIWFPEEASQFWQGFVAHTFFYGGIAGWYLASKKNKIML